MSSPSICRDSTASSSAPRGWRLLDRLLRITVSGGDHRPRRHPLSAMAAAPCCWLILAVLALYPTCRMWMAATSASDATRVTLSTSNILEWGTPLPCSLSSEMAETPRTSLLSPSVIRDEILAETPWAESHGSDHNLYLGMGMLYYGFAYAFQARTIVVLGSVGGFVPRILRHAQRDLAVAGRLEDANLYLVDAHRASAGWGSTFYAENGDSVMRQKYQDIVYLFNTTDAAFEILKERGVTSVDYLHIDADHSFEQSYKDFTNYVQLLSPRGVVSFHDTCVDEQRDCRRSEVPRTVAAISSQLPAWGLQLIDAHYLYRGVAFAIRTSAPSLDLPLKEETRRNFCRNNAARLSKAGVGFARSEQVGTLASLGDFYDCGKTFNASEFAGACPYGKFRDGSGRCSLCIPGMTGDDCTEFMHDGVSRENEKKTGSDAAPGQQSHLLAAAWLSERQLVGSR